MNYIMIITIIVFYIIAIQYSTVFEETYSQKLINMYIYPWWRLLLVILVIASAIWSPYVSIIIALVVFFYLSDMESLSKPIITKTSIK